MKVEMKYVFKREALDLKSFKYQLLINDYVISYSDWLKNIQESEDFILFFNQILQESPFEAFFWEVKPTTKKSLNDRFEFVLIESKALNGIQQNDAVFKNYFKADKTIVSFPNLNHDAHLIAPCLISAQTEYAHLANFVRTASKPQVLAFWKRVGKEFKENIGSNTKWLSTSGLGVYWLHVRIDSKPKYYQHSAYKNIASNDTNVIRKGKYNIAYLKSIHKFSSNHYEELMDSNKCGCFYCCQTFKTKEIEEWIDDEIDKTAICPKCGIDAILSDKHPISESAFLTQMQVYFFN